MRTHPIAIDLRGRGGVPGPSGLLLAIVLALAPTAGATVDWEPIEPLAVISSASSSSSLFAGGAWHVAYCLDGRICYRTRPDAGWLPIETVSTIPGTARDPRLAWTAGVLYVVWEDDRTGTPEVWLRARDAVGWSVETCLTPGDVACRAPAIAAENDNGDIFAVWQEGDAPSRIRGRFNHGGWQAPLTVSTGSGSALEPSVSPCLYCENPFVVAWADTRDGAPGIYERCGGRYSWWPEERLTQLPGECRRPWVRSEYNGGDAIGPHAMVVFEHTAPGGVAEIWTVCGAPCNWMSTPLRVSPDDGTPSVSPAIGSFAFFTSHCEFPWDTARPFTVWTDRAGTNVHRMAEGASCPSPDDPVETLSSAGLARATVNAIRNGPRADLLALWTEEIAGVPTLLSRRGSMPACSDWVADVPPALLLAPGGEPADTLRFHDECSGEPLSDRDLTIRFDAALDAALTWDPLQPHPIVHARTDADGHAVFVLRGGGCSQQGAAYYTCPLGGGGRHWGGAKSPDMNGDCLVGNDDLAVVEAAVGTNDFCADLDGSGLVDAADVSIVQATLGDHCSDNSGVESAPGVARLSLGVEPNPCYGQAALVLRGVSTRARVRLLDAGGRLVRTLDASPASDGTVRIDWDTRDASGHPAPAGLYLISATVPGGAARRSVLVLR